MQLDIQNISIRADGRDIVSRASFSIQSGEAHVLMGRNGSGKSTLLNGIFGHPRYEITSGSILLDGADMTRFPTEQKAKKGLFLSMQYLPEIEGVTLMSFLHKAYRSLHDPKISVMDFYALLEEKARAFDIDPSFLKRGVNVGLSGGEKKLSEVLQLAVLRPSFAFLDEIDSGVDVDSLRKVFRAITALKEEGMGFMFITHYPAILEHMTPDRVYVMKEGSIVKEGGGELVKEITDGGFGSFE